MTTLAPIVIFTYKRLDSLRQTVEALKRCDLAKDSDVIIFSDAPKGELDALQVAEVRAYLNEINGFKSVKLNFAEINKGLADSVIDGVTKVIDKYGKVIVLEDDLRVAANFLQYMNSSLLFYENNLKVFSISGYTIPIKSFPEYKFDIYFTPRASSWGWATWKNRWAGIDWQISDYSDFKKDKVAISEFNKGGSDLSGMLKKQMAGAISSWAVRWCYHQYRVNALTVYPLISKIQNTGFSDQATHSNVYNRYRTPLDDTNKTQFLLSNEVRLDPFFLNQFQDFFSLKTRAYNKIKTYFYKAGILSNKE